MIEDFYSLDPYCLDAGQKEALLTKELKELTLFHKERCVQYAKLLAGLGFDDKKIKRPEDIPFFPVRLFKSDELLSIPRESVFKVMTSSGTTGQAVSRIYLDRETAIMQQKVLVKILSDYVGKKRLPMLVIDSPQIIKDRIHFTARGAAIIGLEVIARDRQFALNDDMSLNINVVRDFLEKYQGQEICLFGFTFIVWQHFYHELRKLTERFDFSRAYLITGGGWKKLISQSVSVEKFKESVHDTCGIIHFIDHYGMVEQTGCIYAECEYGHLHASIYSDIIPRRHTDFSPCAIGEPGILQTLSVLPHSYPGHSLLTEDEGVVLGIDDCPCGRKGKYIKINGRLQSAELRGCSDIYATAF